MKKILDFLKHPALLRVLTLITVTLSIFAVLVYVWAMAEYFVAGGLHAITPDTSKAAAIVVAVLVVIVAWTSTKTALRFLTRRFRDPLPRAGRAVALEADAITAWRSLALEDQELAKKFGHSAVGDALRSLPENASMDEKIALLEQLEPSQFKTLSLEQRARHEAEHAVVAHALGQVVVCTDTRLDGNVGGQVVLRNRKLAPEDLLRQRIAISVAPVASALRSGDLDGHSNDLLKATRDALALRLLLTRDPTLAATAPNVDSIICDAAVLAADIVEHHSRAVDEIARRLVEQSHLEGRDVIRIIHEHAPSPVLASSDGQRR